MRISSGCVFPVVYTHVWMVYIETCVCMDASPAIRYRWQGKVGLGFSSEMSDEYCYRQGIREQSGISEPFPDGNHVGWISPQQARLLSFHATPIDSSLLDGVSQCVCV